MIITPIENTNQLGHEIYCAYRALPTEAQTAFRDRYGEEAPRVYVYQQPGASIPYCYIPAPASVVEGRRKAKR